MSAPRGLSAEEQAAWEKLAATVEPLDSRTISHPSPAQGGTAREEFPSTARTTPPMLRDGPRAGGPGAHHIVGDGRLDGQWDRKLKAGTILPDFTLDLHGHGLDEAYRRLMSGLAQARAMGARTILLVTGKSRPVDPADRGTSRGAIRAKVLDWLAASEHGAAISAVRKAHRQHGGDGALYLVLKRDR
ncbi:MAG: Smr/MutS family protein [Qipengyuania sp.]